MQINNINLNSGEEMQHLTAQNTTEAEIHVYNNDAVQKERLDKCMNCQYVTAERMCSECNCPVVMMSQFNFKTCPKGYWE